MTLSEHKPRFVVADSIIAEELGQRVIVVLSDIGYWTKHYEALQQWCQENNSEVQGMTINIPDDQTLTAFCLKWA